MNMSVCDFNKLSSKKIENGKKKYTSDMTYDMLFCEVKMFPISFLLAQHTFGVINDVVTHYYNKYKDIFYNLIKNCCSNKENFDNMFVQELTKKNGNGIPQYIYGIFDDYFSLIDVGRNTLLSVYPTLEFANMNDLINSLADIAFEYHCRYKQENFLVISDLKKIKSIYLATRKETGVTHGAVRKEHIHSKCKAIFYLLASFYINLYNNIKNKGLLRDIYSDLLKCIGYSNIEFEDKKENGMTINIEVDYDRIYKYHKGMRKLKVEEIYKLFNTPIKDTPSEEVLSSLYMYLWRFIVVNFIDFEKILSETYADLSYAYKY